MSTYQPDTTRRLEVAIVRALVEFLRARGFEPHSVADDEYTTTRSMRAVLDAVFAVDECTLRFRAKDTSTTRELFGVLLIGGNGEDIISDWSAPIADPAGFRAAMDAFGDKMQDAPLILEVSP